MANSDWRPQWRLSHIAEYTQPTAQCTMPTQALTAMQARGDVLPFECTAPDAPHSNRKQRKLWAGSAPACAGLLSKPLFFASCLIVGQVAQFGNWAYSANQNKRYPRSPSDTKPPTFEIFISSSTSPPTGMDMDLQFALNQIVRHIDRSPPSQNTRFHTSARRAECAPQVPSNDMWGHPVVATLTTVWVRSWGRNCLP